MVVVAAVDQQLPALPPGTPHVHYLRSLDDAARLRDAMQRAGELVVIGGGFLGLETASTAASMGLKVTLVESEFLMSVELRIAPRPRSHVPS